MRRALTVLLLLAFPAAAAEQTARLEYSGWFCARCGPKIEKALRKTRAVKSAIVTLDRATVVFDDRFLDLEKLASMVEAAGPYKVTKKSLVEPTPAPSPTPAPAPRGERFGAGAALPGLP